MASAKKAFSVGWSHALEALIEYETPKIVHIHSKRVGLINRLVQITIIIYIALCVIWTKKGYQDTDQAISATITKLKGVAQTNYGQLNITLPGGYNGTRVWDIADYVIPPQENDAFFVMTNVIATPRQKQGRCPEDRGLAPCQQDSDCRSGFPVTNGNGVMTGRCVTESGSCEIAAWCPVENNKLPLKNRALLEDSQNFTVLIKNYIFFPKFHVKRRNILETQNPSYLKSCHFNSESPTDRLCPIFRIGDIIKAAHEHEEKFNATYDSIAVLGGVIVILIEWDCNLDYNIGDCLPVYSFSRLDEENAPIAKGSNFRFAFVYERDHVLYRDLFKAYGIRFIIKVAGRAGKFSIMPLLQNIGSGIGLLALASVLCDIIILNVLRKRKLYREKKFLYVQKNDDHSNVQNHAEEVSEV